MLKDLSYLDSNRTGIWGWSYGGYLTLMTLMQVLDMEKVRSTFVQSIVWFLSLLLLSNILMILLKGQE